MRQRTRLAVQQQRFEDAIAITRDSNAGYKLSRRYGASANLCRITND
jgi:hypothetical protein